MNLLGGGDHFVEIADDSIALCLRDAHDLGDKARIEKQGFPTSDGVSADEWMLRNDRITANWPARSSRALRLNFGGMQSSESFKVFLHWSRKGIVSGVLGSPQSIAPSPSWRTS